MDAATGNWSGVVMVLLYQYHITALGGRKKNACLDSIVSHGVCSVVCPVVYFITIKTD